MPGPHHSQGVILLAQGIVLSVEPGGRGLAEDPGSANGSVACARISGMNVRDVERLARVRIASVHTGPRDEQGRPEGRPVDIPMLGEVA